MRARDGAVKTRTAVIIATIAALTIAAGTVAAVLGVGHQAAGHPALTRRAAPLYVRLTTSGQCNLPRLPAWTGSPVTTVVFNSDIFRPNTSVVTYTQGLGKGLTTWNQGQWLIAMDAPYVATSEPAEQAFASVHLPGRGAAVWTDPGSWQLNALWCIDHTAHHLHLTGMGPSAAVVVAQVVNAWNRSHANRFRCQPTPVSLTCQAIRSPP